MLIRPFCPGDEPALFAVFRSAVHGLAGAHYTAQQLQAWAPADFDPALWAQRVQSLQPFVLQVGRDVVAYADVQDDGGIDHFFVAASHARQGLGRQLMAHVHRVAKDKQLPQLYADVSLTAQPFFAACGFQWVTQQWPVVRGCQLSNARMQKTLLGHG